MSGRYALMWSGGKDCALALERARRAGLEVTTLINFHDAASGRVRFHATTTDVLNAQSAAMGINLSTVPTTWTGMDERFQVELASLRDDGFAGVVFGNIHLADVRAWYEERVSAAGLEHVEPLWGEAPRALLEEFVGRGGRAVVTCVDTTRLDASWLGRIVDLEFAADIAGTGADPCGENGEYHSFVFAGPLFAQPLAWSPGVTLEDERFLQLDIGLQPPG